MEANRIFKYMESYTPKILAPLHFHNMVKLPETVNHHRYRTYSPAAEVGNPALLDKVFFFTDYFSLGYVTGFAKTGLIAGVRNCSYSPFSSAK